MSLLLTAALAALPHARQPAASAVAFVGVDVVPMDREGVLRDQTVIVQGDRIAAIGPSKEIAVPEGAERIDGKGRYLMPGLADMHVHSWDASDLTVFVANGVTTVRNMFGSQFQLGWREKIAAGDLLGPAIYTAGPIIDGDPPVWPGSAVLVDAAKADALVAEQKAAGYDFLKVYARLPLGCYDAVVASAKTHGMRVMGHVPSAVGLAHALESKQESIEHLDGLVEATQKADSPFADKVSFQNQASAWKHVDDAKIAEFAKRAAASGTWNCPTLVVYQKWVTADELESMLARPEMKYVPPMTRRFWQPENNYLSKMPKAAIESTRAADADRKRAVGILHRNGARILLGTDMGNPFVVAGFALHEELANLVASGLSPYEALRAGTSGAAEFMRASGEWGTVAVGRRADLLLLGGNPLEDVAHASRPSGVMIRGWWYPEAELRGLLDDLAKRFGTAAAGAVPAASGSEEGAQPK